MNVVEEKWDEILNNIRREYCPSNIAYSTWIAPLTIYKITDDDLFILVDKEASVDHIEKKYTSPFVVSVAEITGKEYKVSFVTKEENVIEEKMQMAESTKKASAVFERANLYSKYTFDTFVVGKNNNYAHAASYAVSKNPGEVYNPLFIYGGVGLGKTHLMHSIARRVLENDPTKKVLYVTSETFTNEMIDALKVGKTGNELAMITFRDKYRNNDILLIDDIQFIENKTGIQEEFFHTFNHLHTSGKAIIISSDRPPKDIKTLESRLSTRFGWGLTVDITIPDYETRMAILKKKIENDNLENFQIPEEVIEYIANNIKKNIRELEGTLNRLVFLSKLEKRPIDIPLAAEALKDFISPDNNKNVTDELILEVVSEHFNISVQDIVGKKRNADIVIARQIVMYLCRAITDSPFSNIGILLGNRDHSTIIYGARKIEEDLKKDETLSNTVNTIRKKINPL